MADFQKKSPLIFPSSINVIEEDDLVLGGIGNGPNRIAEPLVDRTDFLKNAVENIVENSQNLVIGDDVQAWATILDSLSGLAANGLLRKSGSSLSAVSRWIDNSVAQGRLTLETGIPFNNADATGDRIYYTPFTGNSIALYTSGEWRYFNFSELSFPLNEVGANQNADVFVTPSGGDNLSLSIAAWTNDTTRAAIVTRKDGVVVAANDFSRRLLGTVRTTDAGISIDSDNRRFVWNIHSTASKSLRKQDNGDWSYAGTTWRPMNNKTSNRVELVNGLISSIAHVRVVGVAGTNGQLAIGANSLNPVTGFGYGQAAGNQSTTIGSWIEVQPRIGLNFYQGLEIAQGASATFEAQRTAISGRWAC